MKHLVGLSVMVLSVVTVSSGCSSRDDKIIDLVKEMIELQLIDSSSAQYRNVHVIEKYGKVVVCGEVNSKNRMGGYVGYTTFVFNGPHRDTVEFDHADYGDWCD